MSLSIKVASYELRLRDVVVAAVLLLLWRVRQLRKARRDGPPRFLSFDPRKTDLPPVGSVIGRVTELNVFPAKSCRGVGVHEVPVSRNGLAFDRKVMILNAKNVPVTQRMRPELARVRVTYSAHANQVTMDAGLPGLAPLNVHLDDVESDASRAERIDLHSLVGPCVAFGDVENAWINRCLSELSGRSITGHRLVCLVKDEVRILQGTPSNLLMDNSRPHDGTLLADLAPFTLASEASMRALREQIRNGPNGDTCDADGMTMERFRTNVVMEAEPELAFLEDHVAAVKIGDLELRVIGPTFRCVIPTVDQNSGEAGFRKNVRTAEPIASLRRLRSGGARFGISGLMPVAMGGSRGIAPLFGIYLGTQDAEAEEVLRVGDSVTVLAYRKPPGMLMQALDGVAEIFGLGSAYLA